MASKVDERRKGILRTDRVHEYWLKRATEDTVALTEQIGWQAVDNIGIGNGNECYACGSPKHLNKCHVIPNSCGGSSSDPSNLFMMCSDCHQGNPDTIYPDIFWNFVRNREPFVSSTIKTVYRNLSSLLAEATPDHLEVFDRFSRDVDYQGMVDLYNSIHYLESSSTLNNQVTVATTVGLLWKHILMDDWATRPKASVPDTESVAS